MLDATSPCVIDMHSDIATDITIRRARGEREVFRRHHFDKLKKSGVYGLFSVLWVEPEYRQQSAARLTQLLSALLADVQECHDVVEIVTSQKALTDAMGRGKIGLFLGVEGMTFVEQWPVLELDLKSGDAEGIAGLNERFDQSLALLKTVGLRHTILCWGEDNQIASGPIPGRGEPTNRGLTSFGRSAVKQLRSNNILVDISHLDDASVEGVFEAVDGLLIASHSNARSLCNVSRNLTDAQIDEIGRRKGVIGINAYPEFIDESDVGLDRFIDHIVYIANRIGIGHVGLGFDFTDFLSDASKGWELPGVGLKSARDVPLLIERMHERGFLDSEIQAVSYENALRVMGATVSP